MPIAITHKIKDDETSPAMFGEHEHLTYSGVIPFAALVFEAFTEHPPSSAQLSVFNLILNLCFDHGPHSPSGSATILSAKEGKSMGESVAMGIAQINDTHGGAGEPLMKLLYKIHDKKITPEKAINEYKESGKRLPGFGHRVYKDYDPRAELLLKTAQEKNIGLEFIHILEQLQSEIANQLGKNLPINIDGAIAASLCGLGLQPELGKAVFIIARSAGLCVHYLNTRKQENYQNNS